MLTAQILHKGINLVTNVASTSNPQKNRKAQLRQIKVFGRSHGLTKSDWNQIMDAAQSRLPIRLSQPEL